MFSVLQCSTLRQNKANWFNFCSAVLGACLWTAAKEALRLERVFHTYRLAFYSSLVRLFFCLFFLVAALF